MSALSPIFPGHVKPARPGIYARDYGEGEDDWHYCRWDGRRWRCGFPSLAQAQRFMGGLSYSQNLPWCGLSFNPEGR